MPTFASLLARPDVRAVYSVEIAGWGRREGAVDAASQRAYRWCSRNPASYGYTAANAARYLPALAKLPAVVSEEIQFRDATTLLGEMSFDLIDVLHTGASTHGWGTDGEVLTPLLSVHAPTTTWTLKNPCSSNQTVLWANDTAGMTVGDALWISDDGSKASPTDSECVIITSVGGVSEFEVLRGCYGTTATTHAAYPDGGQMWDRPHSVRGRGVKLILQLIDPLTGILLPETQDRTLWTGTVDDFELTSPTTYSLRCKPALGRLDRYVGREQYVCTVPSSYTYGQNIYGETVYSLPPILSSESAVRVPNYEVKEDPPASGIYYRHFFCRIGDAICEVRQPTDSLGLAIGNIETVSQGMWGTSVTFGQPDADDFPCQELLLTEPNPSNSNTGLFVLDSEVTCHPVDILLMLITSTGEYHGANYDYDLLPKTWGCGTPYTQISFRSFREIKQASANVRFPRLCLGWDGKPVEFRKWVEENILAAFGWFLYLDGNGLISLGSVGDWYPGDAAYPVIDESDLVGEITVRAQLQEAITQQSFSYDWDFVNDKPRKTLNFIYSGAGDDNSNISYTVRGVDPDAVKTAALLGARANANARLWVVPLPRYDIRVGLDRILDVDLGDKVTLQDTVTPNTLTGERGLDSVCLVVSRAVNLEANTYDLGLLLLPNNNTGLWAPAGKVTAYTPATHKVTLDYYQYCDGLEAGAIPESDATGFQAGDFVILVDDHGALLCNNVNFVVSIDVDCLYLGGDFYDGVGPLNPVAGNRIVYCRYEEGTAPEDSWDARMKQHVAHADSSRNPPSLPNGDAYYQYGI